MPERLLREGDEKHAAEYYIGHLAGLCPAVEGSVMDAYLLRGGGNSENITFLSLSNHMSYILAGQRRFVNGVLTQSSKQRGLIFSGT